jgi:outer membrane protein assembly factor BamB
MNYTRAFAIALLVTACPTIGQGTSQDTGKANWPQFRGAHALGVSAGTPPPTQWDISTGKNIIWKTPVPGLAHSSPIVWGNKLFVTTAVNDAKKPDLKVGLYGSGDPADDDDVQSWKVLCLDKQSGKILWEQTAHKGKPRIHRHTKATHANCTPATDGKRVIAYFGSEGLFCYDLNGKLIWKKDFGVLRTGPYNAPDLEWGVASSPVLHKDRVYLQCDVLNGGFLACLDAKDGREIWRTPRGEEVAAWSTPAVHESDGFTYVIVNGWKHMGAYDAATGKELWKLSGGGDIPVPTPIVSDGLAYICNAHGRNAPIYAIKLTATGDLTPFEDGRLARGMPWWERRNGAYMQTPIVIDGLIYSCTDSGILNCYDAKSGEKKYQQRLGTGRTGFSASPVACGGKLYFTSEMGDIFVVKAGPTFQQIAENSMGEITMASPAISSGVLYFRTRENVVAVGAK